MPEHFTAGLLRYLDRRHSTLDALTICRDERIRVVRTSMAEDARSALVDAGDYEIIMVSAALCNAEALAALWHEIGHHFFPPASWHEGEHEADAFANSAILKQASVIADICWRCQRCWVARPLTKAS